jgi:hypothetical protein
MLDFAVKFSLGRESGWWRSYGGFMRSGVGLCGRRSRGDGKGVRRRSLVGGGWGLGLDGFREVALGRYMSEYDLILRMNS